MSTQTIEPRLSAGEFSRAYIVTMRPYLLFVSGITGIAGMSFVTSLSTFHILLIAGASFLAYGFGQALTDCFQMDTDALSAPYRPMVQGIISKTSVFVVSIFGLLLCVGIFAAFDPRNIPLGALAGIGLATYTPFKRRWWGGPFYNAWIVVVLFLMGYFAGLAGGDTKRTPEIFLTGGAVFFGYANFVLSGYFKDIDADRATGYNTIPVVFGRAFASWVSDSFTLLAMVCAGVTNYMILSHRLVLGAYDLLAICAMTAGITISAYGQWSLHRVTTDAGAHTAIACTVHAYLLLLSSTIVLLHPEWWVAIISFYAGFVLVLHTRPAKEQI